MHLFVRDALNEHALMDAYLARPTYQQNDYLGWIAHAKLEATKTKRLNQMLEELEGGRLYMNMTWKAPFAAKIEIQKSKQRRP